MILPTKWHFLTLYETGANLRYSNNTFEVSRCLFRIFMTSAEFSHRACVPSETDTEFFHRLLWFENEKNSHTDNGCDYLWMVFCWAFFVVNAEYILWIVAWKRGRMIRYSRYITFVRVFPWYEGLFYVLSI